MFEVIEKFNAQSVKFRLCKFGRIFDCDLMFVRFFQLETADGIVNERIGSRKIFKKNIPFSIHIGLRKMIGRQVFILDFSKFVFYSFLLFLQRRFDAEFGIRRTSRNRFRRFLNYLFWFFERYFGCCLLVVGCWIFRFWS